ncbi:glycoside hydrolase family 9 protein [Allomuricauda sp. SCSIO 65647]|uniref:glycoside hydrolase family 9 protein n=1 Tax=Allomuricauda sp. SCSIO 65647 TaxID=2908843 RepID=UPI001F33FF17|nr:glycoside hydrolase family 9 protein [Muricauda sp. SCSIO 65647]UJH66225.1 glycoside hydrolase family 9 protein [Muricauda sp. SCSIO 65647]
MYRFLLLILLTGPSIFAHDISENTYIRVNQLGYLPEETKIALVFSNQKVNEDFLLISSDGEKTIATIRPNRSKQKGWGTFEHYYTLDFTKVTHEGHYFLQGKKTKVRSQPFKISKNAYLHKSEKLLEFMRQQRCGYNPFFDMICHQRDGRSFYGPMPDSTFVDASGGWHDAGDQLKYLITGSYATAHMLKAFELYPNAFLDRTNALGQPFSNDIPDVLDEAKWGLDWILKLHPAPDQLIHQIADDRDHRGWKMPDNDHSDYGWGGNSYRAAYFATGTPQGLNKYKSEATGVSNLAGRSAAAMAIAHRIWKNKLKDSLFAEICLKAAKSLYSLGKEKEGYQQGNSYGAPYRYSEKTWADDMEWGAAELYKATGDREYLDDAKKYALKANTVSWMQYDSVPHYQYYPFVNMGHFALYEHVDDEFKKVLTDYYKIGIEENVKRGQTNPYQIGIPFIWCSNNLLTSLITQGILYEKMTGDDTYTKFMILQRDWLFGRNPWGTSMFTKMPEAGEYPLDVHTSTWAMTKKEVPGGLVDGPVYNTIYESLKGLKLNEPDEFAMFQNDFVTYHDDIGDYSTNEPTMDGTAGAILMMAHWGDAQ